jgi:hypothetical protein
VPTHLSGAYRSIRVTGATAAVVSLLLAVTAAAEPAASVTAIRTSDGVAVDVAQTEAALSASSLSVKSPAGARWSVYGIDVYTPLASQIFLSASSELITIATLAGAAHIKDAGVLQPGQAAVMMIATGKLQRTEFDARRLAASSSPVVAAEFTRLLEPVMAKQQRRRWWGYYTPMGINASAPVPAALESLRRDYLLDPAVVRLRRDAAGNLQQQRQLTAERFVTALAAHDANTVAGLVDPSVFIQVGTGWMATRAGYAQQLTGSKLATQLVDARVAATGGIHGEHRSR